MTTVIELGILDKAPSPAQAQQDRIIEAIRQKNCAMILSAVARNCATGDRGTIELGRVYRVC